jgi:endonuclease YncB( thermonuclease family)
VNYIVKDGDTVIVGPGGERHMKDQEYRLVGFDTPETTRGKCPSEIEKGNRATAQLIKLLDGDTTKAFPTPLSDASPLS